MDEKLFTCLNGRFVLAHRAAVAVSDRGFRYGDGLFETMRVQAGIPLAWDAHMQRLQAGLQALSIGFDSRILEPYAKKLLQKNHASDGFLRLAISRGAGSRGYAPYPPGMPATWVMEWLCGLAPPSSHCRLWLASQAKIPPQCLPTAHKTAQGLGSTLAIMEAQQHGCDDALQLAVDGAISEAASANIFWVRNETLYTPSLETGCLAGITRESVLRLSPFPTRIVHAPAHTLEQADAVFLTNSRVGVWPVVSLAPLGYVFATTHPLYRTLMSALDKERAQQQLRHRMRWSAA